MVSGNHDLSSRLEYRLEGSKGGTESLKGLRKYKKGECSVETALLQEEGQLMLKESLADEVLDCDESSRRGRQMCC